jgi:16S rRNA processing protein RimM
MVAIGRVVKPQGRKGEVAVEPLSDRPDRFPSLRAVSLPAADGGARVVKVQGAWPHKGRFVVKLEGVDSIEQAEALRGMEMRIAEEELDALPAGSYYHHQLLGLAVEDEAGHPLGRVAELLETGGTTVLVVRGSAGKETLLPLAERFVRTVDVAAGRLVVTIPEMVDVDG